MKQSAAEQKKFPWYDAVWLNRYVETKRIIRDVAPDKLKMFEEMIAPLRTRPDFEPIKLTNFLSEDFLRQTKAFIADLPNDQKETHEIFRFGRTVLHNHELFNEHHRAITDQISELVGEEVEPSYNFLSLYYNMGVCEVHMDAPEAKYTVDLLIEQTVDWPIYISNWQDWPENLEINESDWQAVIKNNPANKFSSYSLEPGGGVIFSGSNSWHYRDAIYQPRKKHHCHLIFFHFIPKGTKAIIDPKNWGNLLDIPELYEAWNPVAPP